MKELKKKIKEHRFVKGSQYCQKCGTYDGVNQLVSFEKVKGLPVEKHFFICLKCYGKFKFQEGRKLSEKKIINNLKDYVIIENEKFFWNKKGYLEHLETKTTFNNKTEAEKWLKNIKEELKKEIGNERNKRKS